MEAARFSIAFSIAIELPIARGPLRARTPESAQPGLGRSKARHPERKGTNLGVFGLPKGGCANSSEFGAR